MSNDRERRKAVLTRQQIENVRGFLNGQADDAEEAGLYDAICSMALAYLDLGEDMRGLQLAYGAACLRLAELGEKDVPLNPPADRKAVTELIEHADAMLAPLGYHGQISARDDRVSAFSDALERVRALTPDRRRNMSHQPVVPLLSAADEQRIRDLDGMHVGLLTDEEYALFERAVLSGIAKRSYDDMGGGLAKVRALGGGT